MDFVNQDGVVDRLDLFAFKDVLVAVVSRFQVEIAFCGNASCRCRIFAVILKVFRNDDINACVVQGYSDESVIVVDVKGRLGEVFAHGTDLVVNVAA